MIQQNMICCITVKFVFSWLEFTIIKRIIGIRSHKLRVNNSWSYEKNEIYNKAWLTLQPAQWSIHPWSPCFRMSLSHFLFFRLFVNVCRFLVYPLILLNLPHLISFQPLKCPPTPTFMNVSGYLGCNLAMVYNIKNKQQSILSFTFTSFSTL